MRKRMAVWAVCSIGLTTLATGLLWANGATEPVNIKADGEGATMEGTQAVVEAGNQAALDLYGKLKSEPGNLFFSPYSISTALAMTYEGARGKTADEMRQVFHFPEDAALRRPAYAALYNSLNSADGAYQLSVANALWAQKDYAFEPEYMALVKKYYGGAATPVDFAGATEAARLKINGWVEDHTQDRIQNLFEQGTLDALTTLVLTNAVYFKGTWVKQFDAADTKDGEFRPETGEPVQVPLMHLHTPEAKFGYAEIGGIQALELPYNGDKLSMLVLLPESGKLAELEAALTPAKLEEWRKALQVKRVLVTLPKFKANTKYELNETLAALGMPTAFSANADFSGMEPKGELFIQLVVHQAFVEVNEEGTEAAAATGVAMGRAMAPRPEPIPVFNADHPFLFLIQEKEHGTILFLGRMTNPKG